MNQLPVLLQKICFHSGRSLCNYSFNSLSVGGTIFNFLKIAQTSASRPFPRCLCAFHPPQPHPAHPKPLHGNARLPSAPGRCAGGSRTWALLTPPPQQGEPRAGAAHPKKEAGLLIPAPGRAADPKKYKAGAWLRSWCCPIGAHECVYPCMYCRYLHCIIPTHLYT